jgi:DNA invertase Pin-like site-specific DNA recombinase
MNSYVIYSRKSLEDDDKQIQSISSQEDEMRNFATKCNLTIITPLFSESKSAKAPGRPVFESMMKRVERGEIRGILCWKLDRLARNPVDGGRIIWAIKQHGLIIRTPHQSFSQAEDNLILMYIEFGMAQKYVDDLSRNTTRGLEAKLKKGWRPGIAPIGYLNSKVEERGQRTIFRDPERFDAVRRLWDLALTGDLSPARIQKIANDDWGFRTRQTKKTGGKPLARSAIYKVFSDPFYYGQFEYPKGSGQWYQGQHEPMITQAEYKCVQKILHQKTNPRPSKEFGLPFRGLIKCGECGSTITAHFKAQVRCTACGYKSSVKNRDSCARCGLSINGMKNPKIRKYAYYHCTRTLNPLCRQKCISASALEQQLTNKLQCFGLAPELRDWGLKYIEKLHDQEVGNKALIVAERKKAYEQCIIRLENLVKLKTAPENADNSLLSDEEYQKQRAELLARKSKLGADVSTFNEEMQGKERFTKDALEVVAKIKEQPLNDNLLVIRETLSALGLNHVLKGRDLEIKPQFPFSELPRNGISDQINLSRIEPEKSRTGSARKGTFDPACPTLEQDMDEDRTKSLKTALEKIWENLDPHSQIFKRYPFEPGALVVPILPRGRHRRRLDSLPE